MLNCAIRPPIDLFGTEARDFEEAAYLVRQFAIQALDDDARRLVRRLKDCSSLLEARLLEANLRTWRDLHFKASPTTH